MEPRRAVPARPARPERQGRALLPALRHGPVEPRGRARLRGGRGPVDLRSLPAGRRAGRVAARLDDHPVDAPGEPGRRGQPGRLLRGGRARGGDPDPGRGARRAGPRGGGGRRPARAGRRAGRAPLPPALPVRRRSARGGRGRLRDDRGRHGHRPHRPGLRRGRHGRGAAARLPGAEPGRSRRALHGGGRALGRPRREGGRSRPRRRPRRAGAAAPGRDPPPPVPPLLALRHAAPLLRQALVVRPHDRGRRSDAGAQPPHRLAPRARARRPLRPVARGQRRLVDLARPLLGHAAAPLALRRLRPHRRRRLLRGAARPRDPGAAGALRPAPAVRGRGRTDLRLRRRHGARARGRRRLVRQRRDAVRPGPPPVRHRWGPGGALPGRLHLRGPRPDAGLVLLPARREHPPLRRGGLPQRRVPGPDARRRGPEDEQEQGQRHRARDRARPPGGRRLPLVPPDRPEPVGLLPLQPRGGGRGDAPLPADALEHPRVPGHLRGPARRLVARRRRGRGGAPPHRPLDPVAPRRDGRGGHRPSRGLRRHRRRAGAGGLPRRPLELVRADVPPPLLGRPRASPPTGPGGRGRTPRPRSRRSTSAWPP